MGKLANFFKGTDTRFGVFYPSHYITAVFGTLDQASRARQTLIEAAGVASQDVIAVPGDEVVRFAKEHLQQDGLWQLLMAQISRTLDTEQTYADHDLVLAQHGAAFLAAYCPTQSAKNRAWKALEPLDPIVARHYTPAAVEHLTGEA